MKFYVLNIYSPTTILGKWVLYNHLESWIKDKIHEKWILGGDFNSLISSDKKLDGVVDASQREAMMNLRDFISSFGLIDLELQGSNYTWNNRRKRVEMFLSRLDWILFSMTFFQAVPSY